MHHMTKVASFSLRTFMCQHTASHLFDTLQTVIGLLYVSVHRRNRVHVDCPSSASTCQPLNWSVLQQKHTHVSKLAFSQESCQSLPPPWYCTLVCINVCVWCCAEISIWQVTSSSGSPKDHIPLSYCDTLNKPWRLPRTSPSTFGEDTQEGLESVWPCLKHLRVKMNIGGDTLYRVCQHYLRKLCETLPSWPVRTLTWHVLLCLHCLDIM